MMMVPQGAPGRSLSPQKHTSALSDTKLVSGSGHNPTEASSSPLHPRADPQTLSLQPAHALPHLLHLIRGLHYQYLSQFFFPLLLFFEQLLQQVAERLALLHDHPLQQKDSGTHISIALERPPCPDPAKHLPYPERSWHRGQPLSSQPNSSPAAATAHPSCTHYFWTIIWWCQPPAHPGQPQTCSSSSSLQSTASQVLMVPFLN